MEADKDGDGRLSFEEFTQMVANTVLREPASCAFAPALTVLPQDIVKQMTLEDLF
jgi:serine/threonine-protein phosphatase 2B regulatory subunit